MADQNMRRLTEEIFSLNKRLRSLELVPQLGNSSLEGTALEVYDSEGNFTGLIGALPDGSIGVNVINGPIPAAPIGITFSGGPRMIEVNWTGEFAGNKPLDFSIIAIHASIDPNFIPTAANTVGSISIIEESSRILPIAPAGYFLKATTLSLAGKRSEPTEEAFVEVGDLVDEESIKLALEGERAAREQAYEEASLLLAELDTRLGEIDGLDGDIEVLRQKIEDDLAAAKAELEAANVAMDAELATLKTDLEAAQADLTVAQGNVTNLETVIIPQLEIDLKANDDAVQADLDAAKARLVTAETEVATANSEISTLLSTTLPDALGALEEADAQAQTALTQLDGHLSTLQGTVEGQGTNLGTLTTNYATLQQAAQTAQDTADAAQAQALLAAGIADSKGRIIYSETQPPVEDQSASNLWVTPSTGQSKAWDEDTQAWVVVQNEALDAALAAAKKAQQDATKALNDAAGALTAAQAAQTTANQATLDAADAHNAAVTAQAEADRVATEVSGKSKVHYGSTPPTSDQRANTLWFDTANSNTPKVWSGNTWVALNDPRVQAAQTAASNAQDRADEAYDEAASKLNQAQVQGIANAAQAAAEASSLAEIQAAESRAATEALRVAKAEALREANEAEAAAKSYADLQASGASGDALAAAKTYAEEQAEEARIAAETAAKADATAKVQAAEARSATDAKAKADAALAAAKTDAQNKADAARQAAISAASADATAKAEDAQAEAAVEAARIAGIKAEDARKAAVSAGQTDATQKANAAKAAAEAAAIAAAKAQDELLEARSAADAAAKANKALSDAKAAAEAALANVTKAGGTIDQKVIASANGKNSITHSTAAPTTSTPGVRPGDIWYRIDGSSNAYAMWRWNGSAWISTLLRNEMIDTLDVNKLRAGSGTFDDLVVDKLWAQTFAAKKITANEIIVGGVTSGALGSNAVTAVKIANGAVTADKIISNAIESKHVSADAITAGKIAANAVTATEIAANAITTVKLASKAITADKIAANTITAGQIAANAITASELAADAVVAGNIQAGAITVDKIATNAVTAVKVAANAITAEKITTGAITADKLAANAVTADKLNVTSEMTAKIANIMELNVVNLAAGTGKIDEAVINKVWADGIAAKSVTASRLTISPGNLIAGEETWANGPITPSSEDPWKYFGINTTDPSIWVDGADTGSRFIYVPIKVKAGSRYRFSVDVRGTAANTAFYARLHKGTMEVPNSSEYYTNVNPKTPANTSYIVVSGKSGAANQWGTTTSEFTIEEDGWAWLRLWPNHTSGSANAGGYQWFKNIRMQEMVGATIIEDGAISTDKLTADAVTADKIKAGSVQTGHMQANSIDADRLRANSITAAQINSTSVGAELITAGTLRTNTTGERLELDSKGIVLYGSDAEEGERVRLGPSGTNLLTIGSSTISDSNVSSSSGNYDQLSIGGDDIADILARLPKGRIGQNRYSYLSSYSTERQIRISTTVDVEPSRQYRVTVTPFDAQAQGDCDIVYQLGWAWGGSPGTWTSTNVLGWGRNPLNTSEQQIPGIVAEIHTGPTQSGPMSFAFFTSSDSSTRGVRLIGTGNHPLLLTVDDMGPRVDDAGAYWTYGDGGGGDTTPPPPATTTKTSTWVSGGFGGDTRSGEVIQGQYGGYGNRSGGWVFPSDMRTALSGSTISKFEVYLYASHWYSGAGGTASIRPNNGSYTGFVGTAFTSANWPRNAGRWVTVPSSWHAAIANGTYKGIGVQTASSSLTYYGRFRGSATKFRATYKK